MCGSQRSRSARVLAAPLLLLGIVIASAPFAPWVTTRTVSGDEEHVMGVAVSDYGWWVFALGLLITICGAAVLVTRVPIIASPTIPAGVAVLLGTTEVRADINEVQGYLRVEGSAAGISSPITRSVHHPIASLNGSWGMSVAVAAAVLTICVGTAGTLLAVVRLASRRIAVPRPS